MIHVLAEQKYSKQVSEAIRNTKSSAPVVKSSNPLDNLDCKLINVNGMQQATELLIGLYLFSLVYSDEFRKGVNALADMLQIIPHPDHLVTLEAICTLIVRSLSSENNLNNNKEVLFSLILGIKVFVILS